MERETKDAYPYVLIRSVMSLDGCIDQEGGERLILSDSTDFDRADAVRAESDAILVGANTLRRDNSRLVLRSEERKQERKKRGLSSDPIKVTLTNSGNLEKTLNFFAIGDATKIVYCPDRIFPDLTRRLTGLAIVAAAGKESVSPKLVLKDLKGRGVETLLIEGGSHINTLFLTAGLVDEIEVVVAPFFVGQMKAPRFTLPDSFPFDSNNRLRLSEIRKQGDFAIMRYLPSERAKDEHR